MTFVSHGRQYEVDDVGAIHQVDARPFAYDAQYVATYDTPAYKRQSELLQALRLGFVLGAHGDNPIMTLLDYGYGNGAFMQFALQHIPYVKGYDVTDIDIPGCEIVEKITECDVITFWDALEHVNDLSFIATLPAKTVVISLPYCHFHQQGQHWFDTAYKHRKPDEHIHHFDPISLIQTMRKMGWSPCAISTHEDIIRKSAHGLQNILTMAFQRMPEDNDEN